MGTKNLQSNIVPGKETHRFTELMNASSIEPN